MEHTHPACNSKVSILNLFLMVIDVSIFTVKDYEGSNTDYMCISSNTFGVVDVSGTAVTSERHYRLEVPSIQIHSFRKAGMLSPRPSLRYVSASYCRDKVPETVLWLGFYGLTFKYNKGDTWAFKIRDFFRTQPAQEVIPDNNIPYCSRSYLDFSHCSVEYSAPGEETRVVIMAYDFLVRYQSSSDGTEEKTAPLVTSFTDAKLYVSRGAISELVC